MKSKIICLLLLFIISNNLFASGVPSLNSLTQNDVNSISKEFATNFAHSILAPASSLGKLMGLEFGIMGGLTYTPEINRVSKLYSTTSNISFIPTAGIIAGLTLPFGINGELNFIPSIALSGVTLQNTSYALKWEVSSLMANPALNIALRLHANSGQFGYSSVINNSTTSNQNVNATTTWENSSLGYNLEISKKFLFIEPYLGFGLINSKTNIGVTGSSNISIFTFSSASSYQSSNSGAHLFTGLNLNLFLFKIGAEYNQMLGNKKLLAKVSFYF
jgi:hypothetical protein